MLCELGLWASLGGAAPEEICELRDLYVEWEDGETEVNGEFGGAGLLDDPGADALPPAPAHGQPPEVYTPADATALSRLRVATLYAVMDLAPAGDLGVALVDLPALAVAPPAGAGAGFSDSDACEVMGALMRACQALRARGVAHRNISPDNILLTHRGVFHRGVKLAGFGLAGAYDRNGGGLYRPSGTLAFSAPEVLLLAAALAAIRNGNHAAPTPQPYDPQCDVWGCGMMLFAMLTGGALPFEHASLADLMKDVAEGGPCLGASAAVKLAAAGASEAAVDLLRRCLEPNPAARITPSEALAHPWLAPAH